MPVLPTLLPPLPCLQGAAAANKPSEKRAGLAPFALHQQGTSPGCVLPHQDTVPHTQEGTEGEEYVTCHTHTYAADTRTHTHIHAHTPHTHTSTHTHMHTLHTRIHTHHTESEAESVTT